MRKLTLVLLVLTLKSLNAAIPQNPVLSSYWVNPINDSVMQRVAKQFEVVRKLNGGYEVLVPIQQSKQLLNLVPEAQLLNFDISSEVRNKSRGDLKGYHDFKTVQTHLESIKNSHPELASIETYGKSMEGRPLLALRLTSQNAKDAKPAILLTASTHGDELITVEVLFGLLDTLVSSYGKDSRLSQIIDRFEIYFVPVVNPDGYVRKERYANGVDPNRDYPWPQDVDHSSNPCISSIMKFYDSHHIKASIDFHAYGEMIMYPWAYTYEALPSLEDNIFDKVTTRMADFNGYVHGQISKVIYVAQGSSADYYHWKHHAWALGIEVGTQKVPSFNQVPAVIKENMESTWTFIESIK